LDKATKAATRAKDLEITAGQHLLQLKAIHDASDKPVTDWIQYCKDTFDLGKSRVYQLLRIAGGKETLDESREAEPRRKPKQREATKQKTEEAFSGTVPENPTSGTKPVSLDAAVAATQPKPTSGQRIITAEQRMAQYAADEEVRELAEQQLDNVVAKADFGV